MNSELHTLVTREGLPRIQAVARAGSVQSAVGSLAAWGAINVGTWYLLGAESRELLSRLSNPTDAITFLLYGGLALGAAMLAFAAIGFITGSSGTIILDGLSLLGVGVWNIIHDFVAIGALRPYGYTIEKPGTMWIVLGICQLCWGFRQLSSFGRIRNWPAASLPASELRDLKKQLLSFVGLKEDQEFGIVKATATISGPLGLDFMSQTVLYTGRLLDDVAVMVSGKLEDCFEIDRKAAAYANVSANGGVKAKVHGCERDLVLSPVSVIVFKRWCGKAIDASDIKRLEAAKAASMCLIRPFLDADDPQLRAAAVSALGTVTESEAKTLVVSLLDDPVASVKAAAVEASRQMKLDSVQDKVVSFLRHSEPSVRIAAVRYAGDLPSDKALIALEQSGQTESVAEVRKEMRRAQNALRRSA